MQNLLSYADGLKPEAKYRYLHKISIIGGMDPFVKLVVGENGLCRRWRIMSNIFFMSKDKILCHSCLST